VTIKAQDKAPDFSLPDQDGVKRTLADFAGKKLILFFYPKANTGG
jgi:peroxiredoxin Q/BCP